MFLGDEFKGTPEGAFARYWDFLSQPNSDVEKAIRLFSPVDLQDSKIRDDVRRQVELDQKNARKLRDVKLAQRYDVGFYTFLATTFVNQEGKSLTVGTVFLHKENNSYRLTKQVGQTVNLDYLVGWNIINLGNQWNDAPRPDYKYSLRLPSPFPSDPNDAHPVTVFFNGIPSHIALHEQWKPNDELGQFFKRVVQIYRDGTEQEFFDLWLPDAAKFWKNSLDSKTSNYRFERRTFKSKQNHWLFTIDFGPNVAVFFADEGPRPSYESDKPISIDHLVVWKGKNGSYKLTQGEELPSGEETFSGNIDSFLGSQPFQDSLRSIVKKAYPEAKLDPVAENKEKAQ